jgi:hypothetical protein
MRSICLGLAILIGSVFGAYAQVTNTPQVGGRGGGPFDDPCHGTDVLVGYNISFNKALNTVAAVCQAQNNGVLVGAVYGLTTHGEQPENTGGGLTPAFGQAPQALRCPAGQAIYGLTIWVNKFKELDSVAATCVSLLPNGGQSQIPQVTNGGETVEESAIGCGSGVAVGMTGRSGALMDSLGLKCSTNFPWHVAAAPTTPTTTPTTQPQQLVTVLLDDDVYNSNDFSDANKFPNDVLTLRAGTEKTENVVLIEIDASGTKFHLHWKECDAILATGCWVYSGADYEALKLQ